MKMRSALITAVYGSVIRAESALSVTRSAGRTLNAMSTDVDRLLGFLPSFHFFWSLPLQVDFEILYPHPFTTTLTPLLPTLTLPHPYIPTLILYTPLLPTSPYLTPIPLTPLDPPSFYITILSPPSPLYPHPYPTSPPYTHPHPT